MKVRNPSSKSQTNCKFQIHGSWNSLARGLAMFLGTFALLNIVGGFRVAGFDANLWWIDLRWLPSAVGIPFLLVSAVCLIGFGVHPPSSFWRKVLTGTCASLLGIVALLNTIQFYVLFARGSIHTAIPIPLSLMIAAAFALILGTCISGAQPQPWRRGVASSFAICTACACAFPLAQMFCFGKSDYRRPAEVVVVLGARVYADGHPSDALADRVRTACQLYRSGLVKKLLFSGGPGEGAIHETEGMKRMAIQLGVKPRDILVDEGGLNTQATVKDTEAICSRLHFSRILVVSHFYHLPRIKLAYQRDGWEVFTVPAKESYLLRQMPYNIAREVAALWVYYLRPLT